MGVYACVRVCVCMCVRACVRVCMCVRACVSFCEPPGALFSESGHTQNDFVSVKFPDNCWPIIVPGLDRSNKDTFLKGQVHGWG